MLPMLSHCCLFSYTAAYSHTLLPTLPHCNLTLPNCYLSFHTVVYLPTLLPTLPHTDHLIHATCIAHNICLLFFNSITAYLYILTISYYPISSATHLCFNVKPLPSEETLRQPRNNSVNFLIDSVWGLPYCKWFCMMGLSSVWWRYLPDQQHVIFTFISLPGSVMALSMDFLS